MNSYSAKIKSRLEYNNFKAVFIIILFTILFIKSSFSHAQALNSTFYKGLTASFGTRSFSISSDIPELNNLKVLEEGGSAGILFGNETLRTRITLAGLYYSSARVPRTINVFELEGLVNYYPLNNLQTGKSGKWAPYFVTGVTQDFVKFFGNYLNQDNARTNNSTLTEPMLGKTLQTRATFGLGLERHIPTNYSFVHLFAEARYGVTILSQADIALKKTSLGNSTAINVGINFGLLK